MRCAACKDCVGSSCRHGAVIKPLQRMWSPQGVEYNRQVGSVAPTPLNGKPLGRLTMFLWEA